MGKSLISHIKTYNNISSILIKVNYVHRSNKSFGWVLYYIYDLSANIFDKFLSHSRRISFRVLRKYSHSIIIQTDRYIFCL